MVIYRNKNSGTNLFDTFKRELKDIYAIEHKIALSKNKAYRPNAHLLYIVMHYNGNII